MSGHLIKNEDVARLLQGERRKPFHGDKTSPVPFPSDETRTESYERFMALHLGRSTECSGHLIIIFQ